MFAWLRRGARILARLAAYLFEGVNELVDGLALMPAPEGRETFSQMFSRRTLALCLWALGMLILAVPSLHPQVASHVTDAMFRLSQTLWNPPGAA